MFFWSLREVVREDPRPRSKSNFFPKLEFMVSWSSNLSVTIEHSKENQRIGWIGFGPERLGERIFGAYLGERRRKRRESEVEEDRTVNS